MDKKMYWASIVLSVVGVAVAAYMTIYKWTSNDSMCLGSGECATVNASPYSEVYGIPVALVGLVGYLAILAILWLEPRQRFFEEQGPLMVFGMGLAGFAFNIYLVYLEFYVIKALCPFCVASQITMTILFVLAVIRLVRQNAN